MKLQRTPLILLLIALLLGGAVLVYEAQIAPQQEAAKVKAAQLFSFQEADVTSLSLTTPAQTLSFVKTPVGRLAAKQPTEQKPDKSLSTEGQPLVWMMIAPQKVGAEPAAIAYLLSLMTAEKQAETLTVPAARRAEFGFDKPIATVEVKLANQQTHRLILGKPTFDRSAIYAQVDPSTDPKQDLAIALVSIDFENGINRPLAEWQIKQSSGQKSPPQK